MPPVFRPFDADREVEIYCRNLPHWRQTGATYFVTFRQADSIPAAVLAEWQEDRTRWFLAQQIDPRWRQDDPERFHEAYQRILPGVRRAFEREQARQIHVELDRCHGSCVLRFAKAQAIIGESLRHFDAVRWWVGDNVVMPNHVHLILQPVDDWPLEEVLGSIKRWTSRRISEWRASAEQLAPSEREADSRSFWQEECYDRIIRDAAELTVFRKYIADNPAKAKLRAGEYQHAVAH